ncbi:MAG: fumarate hydratase [Lachnospiraceae bacterium]|nr:fumarate hydratase [Lachnospiraceae bacterium]
MTEKELIFDREKIVKGVAAALVRAGSTFSGDKMEQYKEAWHAENNQLSKWAMDEIIENAEVAEANHSPLCDDTGIPHVIIEIGKGRALTGDMIDAIYEGIRQGLNTLPGRPMAIRGDDLERISQSRGLEEASDAVVPAPFMLKYVEENNILRVNLLMQGGGPEIRAKTYRVFHRHDAQVVIDEIVSWAKEVVGQLGCSPCTIAVGIGRSHYEASSLMLQAMVEGQYDVQSEQEQYITKKVNESGVGALGLGGNTSVLGTFIKIGPQRASGVRIVCMRPCCCFEPRKGSIDL